MTDLAEPLSTTIDTEPQPSASGGGQPNLSEPVEQQAKAPASLREDIEQAFKADDSTREKEAAKETPKPEPAPKEEPAPKAEPEKQEEAKSETEEKPEPEAKAEEKEQPAKDQREGRRQIDPPAKMLPRAKEVWRNTPREVQTEVERITREHEAEIQRYQQQGQRYERLRDFDELAQRNGRDLRESLAQVHQFETMMAQNPIAALNMALRDAGPRKPDGSPLSLYEVAQHIVQQGPQGYQQSIAQAQQAQQPREDPRIAQMQEQVAKAEERLVMETVIAPFRAAHPRFDELQGTIASFLNSDMIPTSLSASERLAAAYDMAERISPRAHADPPASDSRPAPDRRADDDLSGSRSIKSAPGGVPEEFEDTASSGESIRDSLRNVMRRRA
jgi:hypothetical protein